ncbi:MAG: hypothetical protein RIQ93_2087 [Verrucomicrobiota bacterium]
MRLKLFFPGILLLALNPVPAAIPWRTPEYSAQANLAPATDLLRTFAERQNIPLQITEQSSLRISGDFQNLPPRQFLNAVCEAAELIWFWDGARLQVDSLAEAQTRVLEIETLSPAKAESTFEALGFESGPSNRAFSVRGVTGVLTISGGKKFLELAEPLLRALNAQQIERNLQARDQATRDEEAARALDAKIVVRVFRLTHASAADITVRGASSQTTLPGVARALQNIMGNSPGSLSTGADAVERKQQLTSLRGMGLSAIGKDTAAKGAAASGRTERSEDSGATEQPAQIQAEPRLNAVIVRDSAARMPMYESLIKQLDVRGAVIEISAAVVDIDSDNNKALGVEFLSFGDSKGSVTPRLGFEADRSFNVGNGENVQAQPVFTDGPNLVRGAGFASSVLVPVSGYELLARIRALEEKGEAQLVTSPSVITLDNIEANLRQDDTVYVRVSGNGTGASSDLFDVRTGVQLRVTPTVVQEDGRLSFRLVVDVRDGSFSDLKVDGVPSTRESAINTQAIVPSNKTLLIGGYFVERRNQTTRQIPGLGSIPYVGRLFQRRETNQSRAQRFFFITPRLVDVEKESRVNQPVAVPAKSKDPLPATHTDPETVRQLAHDLAGKSLPPETRRAEKP